MISPNLLLTVLVWTLLYAKYVKQTSLNFLKSVFISVKEKDSLWVEMSHFTWTFRCSSPSPCIVEASFEPSHSLQMVSLTLKIKDVTYESLTVTSSSVTADFVLNQSAEIFSSLKAAVIKVFKSIWKLSVCLSSMTFFIISVKITQVYCWDISRCYPRHSVSCFIGSKDQNSTPEAQRQESVLMCFIFMLQTPHLSLFWLVVGEIQRHVWATFEFHCLSVFLYHAAFLFKLCFFQKDWNKRSHYPAALLSVSPLSRSGPDSHQKVTNQKRPTAAWSFSLNHWRSDFTSWQFRAAGFLGMKASFGSRSDSFMRQKHTEKKLNSVSAVSDQRGLMGLNESDTKCFQKSVIKFSVWLCG